TRQSRVSLPHRASIARVGSVGEPNSRRERAKRWLRAPAPPTTVAPFRAWRGSSTLRRPEPKNWVEAAEREGFEPSVPFDTHDFQSCPIGHSGTSPVEGGTFPSPLTRQSRVSLPPRRALLARVGEECLRETWWRCS